MCIPREKPILLTVRLIEVLSSGCNGHGLKDLFPKNF